MISKKLKNAGKNINFNKKSSFYNVPMMNRESIKLYLSLSILLKRNLKY